MHELEGRTALVTGARRGIGAAAARRLAGHGVSVCLEAVATDISETGGLAWVAVCDEGRYQTLPMPLTGVGPTSVGSTLW